MSYILPQVLVFQQFRQISRTVVGNLNACIIGPHYNVARYDEPSEKELTKLDKVTYEGLQLTSGYPFGTKGVDTGYVRVFFEDISANYADLGSASIVKGVVRNDHVRKVYAGFAGETPSFTVSMPKNSAFRRDSGLGGVCSGDRLYLYYFRDMGNSDIRTPRYVFKSAVTGECDMPNIDDIGRLSVIPKFGLNDEDNGKGLVADRFWYAVVDSDSVSYLAEFKLRPQYVAEFLDMVQDDPSRYSGKTLIDVATSTDGKIRVEHAEGRIYAELPAVESEADIRVKLLSNPVFNKYFQLSSVVSSAWSGTAEPVSDPEGGIRFATIAEFGTLADEEELKIGDTFTHKASDTAPLFTNTVYRFAYAVDGNYVARATEETVSFTPIDTDDSSDATQIAAVTVDDIAVDKAGFSGTKDTVYTAVVVKGGTLTKLDEKGRLVPGDVVFRVSDSAGLDKVYPAQQLVKDGDGNYAVELTSYYLAKLVFYAAAADKYLYEGQTFSVKCFASGAKVTVGFKPMAASAVEFGEGYDTPNGVEVPFASLGKKYDALEIPEKDEDGNVLWTAEADSITFNAGIKVYDSDKEINPDARLIAVSSAQPYVQYRNLVTKYAKTIHTVSNSNDVATMLGTPNMDNPLAQGAYHAKLNSGEQPVYFIAVRSDDLLGYAKALEILEKTDDVYSLVPMTVDDEVLDILQEHVNTMSGAEAKLWRIGVFGFTTDKGVSVYNEAKHPLDRDYTATIEGDLVTFSASDETVAKDEIWKGDKVRFAFQSDGSYKEATVDHVVDNTHVVIAHVDETDAAVPVETDITVPAKVEVWRNLESAQWIDYVANKASSFADRRMYAVFPEVLWNNGKKYPGYIGAAAIAGLISSVPPQQGLTHIELKGFDDIPMVYSSYTRTQLNKVAEYGGLIIMQDVPEGPVYVRHQVSTRSLDGNVLTTELSVTKNLDAISYYFAEVLAPYIGKYNITPVLLKQIETTVRAGISYLGSYNTGSGLLGPMLLLESGETKINGISRHETLKDHVVVSLSLELPLPCNVIELYLSV